MHSELSFILVTILAVVLSGLGKGGLGNAFGAMAVPLMSLAMPPVQAAAIMLPLLLAMDSFAIWSWRRHISWEILKIILLPGLLGVLAGLLIFSQLPESGVRFLVGTIALLFCFNQWFGSGRNGDARKPSKTTGVAWALTSGFTSFGVHAGGAPLSIYLLPLKLEKEIMAGTTAIFFGIINLSKLPAYAQLGELTTENLYWSAILMPLCPLSVWAGVKLVKIMPTHHFYRVLYVGLFLTGLKLLFDALQPLT